MKTVDGGFELSGRWGWSSGSGHCSWTLLGGVITDHPDGIHYRTFLLPRSDYHIEETWFPMGLHATGSNDIVIEVGVAWAGTLLLYESLANYTKTKKIIGVDIFIPDDLKKRIFLKKKTNKIKLIIGDSTSDLIFKKIKKLCGNYKNILIHLDSDHTKDHVLKEIKLYSKLLKKNNYLIVGDTIIEDIPKQLHRKRDWEKGNNPKNAINQFIKSNKNFVIDKSINHKQLLTNNPKGYLKKIK